MRTIFIVGIKTPQWYLRGWRKDLPQAVFIDDWYLHWQTKKLAKIVNKGVELLNDGQPTTIIAHSFGGLLARKMIAQAKKHNVQKLITMASPHTYPFPLTRARQKLNLPDNVEIPQIQTWGGYLDPVVPFNFTRLPNSEHQNLPVEHLAWLLSSTVRKKVLQSIS